MNKHGLFIGKFYPPHRGHHAVIRNAAAQCEQVTVLVMAAAVETLSLDDRVGWLQAEHAADENIVVAGIRCDAPMDLNDHNVWAAQVAAMRAGIRAAGAPSGVDVVFSNDDYGSELARWFDAKHIRTARDGFNSTAIRQDLAAHWGWLSPATRAGLTTRVVVLGAESTGTTTVSTLLRQHYAQCWPSTELVPEYGRDYTSLKWAQHPEVPLDELTWTAEDFDTVAAEQTRLEEAAAASGSPILICDTDAFATAIWERRYLGDAARTAQPWTSVPPRAVYLLTDHAGVPWHDDGMREGDLTVREEMTGWFADALTAAGHSWVLLTGPLDARVDIAVRTVDALLTHRMTFGEPLTGPGFVHDFPR